MPRETLGYVKLEWTCPKCGSRNPGPEKTCLSCGAPQPENVQFEQVEGQELIQDQAEIERAKAGADIHCAFCGARNPAAAETCSQCGADLKKGKRREAGKVVGAYKDTAAKLIKCPRCNAENPETALKCAQCGAPLGREAALPAAPAPAAAAQAAQKPPWLGIALGALLVLLCLCAVGGYIWMSSPRESQTGVVQSVNWTTVVAIEALQPVTYQTWRDEIPQDAEIGGCQDRVHHVQSEAPANANYNKVCGTPYTVDTGTGVGEVVQDCEYEVLLPYCDYTVEEWRKVDEMSLSGSDFSPVYANPQLTQDQRLGAQQESYTIVFETGGGRYTYMVGSLDAFRQFQVGSQWILNINAFDQIVSVEPAR
ncbi:MAG: zinc ribbon domain-containing protein [Anaerolineales bacterium]|nr:zinc ribbon domain-containing protein [Anaerolineales bacterium]